MRPSAASPPRIHKDQSPFRASYRVYRNGPPIRTCDLRAISRTYRFHGSPCLANTYSIDNNLVTKSLNIVFTMLTKIMAGYQSEDCEGHLR